MSSCGLRRRRWYSVTMCSAFRCWRLYSWMRLTWMSKSASGSTTMPVRLRMRCASASLFARLIARQCSWNAASSTCASRPRSRVQVRDPALAHGLVEQPREAGVAQRQEAPRRDAVGDVVEALGPQLGEVPQHGLLQQRRVQRGDAVDGMAADGRQVRHADAPVAGLVDQRHPRHARFVAGMALPHFIQEAAVDLVDDLQRARQKALEQRQPPGLERLGQQRVVGVGQGAPGDVPGLVPRQLALVHQQPHQLGDRDRGMGVVELRREHVGEALDRLALEVEQAQHVLQRAGHEEVLLRQPQALADLRLVVRVEHLGERLGDHLFLHGAVVVADVEVLRSRRIRPPRSSTAAGCCRY